MKKASVKFSFIIPTMNEEKYLKQCIESIRDQGRGDCEVIVVDTDSSDNTVRIARKLGARVLKEPRRGPGIGRNRGARAAKGDILVFTDADVHFPKDFLQQLEKHFRHGGAVFDLAFYDSRKRYNTVFVLWNSFLRTLTKLGSPITNGSCFVFDRRVFEKAGGYSDIILTNEDHDLARRVHRIKRFVFLPIKVYTSGRRLHKWGAWKFVKIHAIMTYLYFFKKKSYTAYWYK
ncbi:MAG: glycosyltransferase [Candidatus Aenigmarchaeota archaeon]|nr:glycosyltransferase [Candidatus Aenigmarchaeota archaeon]